MAAGLRRQGRREKSQGCQVKPAPIRTLSARMGLCNQNPRSFLCSSNVGLHYYPDPPRPLISGLAGHNEYAFQVAHPRRASTVSSPRLDVRGESLGRKQTLPTRKASEIREGSLTVLHFPQSFPPSILMTLITHNHIPLASCPIRAGSSCTEVQGHVTLGHRARLRMIYFTEGGEISLTISTHMWTQQMFAECLL